MSADMIREVSMLHLSRAEAFFAVTIHRDARGVVTPTITNMAPGLSREHADAMHEHLRNIAATLRAAYSNG